MEQLDGVGPNKAFITAWVQTMPFRAGRSIPGYPKDGIRDVFGTLATTWIRQCLS